MNFDLTCNTYVFLEGKKKKNNFTQSTEIDLKFLLEKK